MDLREFKKLIEAQEQMFISTAERRTQPALKPVVAVGDLWSAAPTEDHGIRLPDGTDEAYVRFLSAEPLYISSWPRDAATDELGLIIRVKVPGAGYTTSRRDR